MTVAKSTWCRRDRRQFLACLAATGDPMRAAQEAGRTLEAAFALRAGDAEFAEGWTRAMTIAWELVEARVLARLLAPEDDLPASARILDSKLALAVLQRRAVALVGAPETVTGGAPVSEDEVARVRAEIRSLAQGLRQAERRPGDETAGD
jgi:hypothetical protein